MIDFVRLYFEYPILKKADKSSTLIKVNICILCHCQNLATDYQTRHDAAIGWSGRNFKIVYFQSFSK